MKLGVGKPKDTAEIVALIASHISSKVRLSNFIVCLRSIACQTHKPEKLYISFYVEEDVASVEDVKGTLADVLVGIDTLLLAQSQCHSQFEHFGCIVSALADRAAVNPWLLFADDDDIWHPKRIEGYMRAIYQHASSRTDAVSLPWAAMPLSDGPLPASATAVDAMLQCGNARVETMSMYCQSAVRLAAVISFFDAAPASLLSCPFCDIGWKNHVLERLHCKHVSRAADAHSHWLYYYHIPALALAEEPWQEPRRREGRGEAEMRSLMAAESESSAHASEHASLRTAPPLASEHATANREMRTLLALCPPLARVGGVEYAARTLARHRQRVEREVAGWYGMHQPPGSPELEALMVLLDTEPGGTADKKACIDAIQAAAAHAKAVGRRHYVSYNSLCDLEQAERSSAEQARLFDAHLLLAAAPLRTTLQRFAMDVRLAGEFEARCERVCASCPHTARPFTL